MVDCNLYYSHDDSRITLLLLYVDDVYLLSDCPPRLELVRSQLKQSFDMIDLDQLSHSLDLFSPSGLVATQRGFVL